MSNFSELQVVDKGVIETYLQNLPDTLLNLGVRVLLVLIFLFLGIQCIKILRKILKKSLMKANADLGVIQFLDSFVKVVLYVLLFFMIGTKFGIDASSVVAVLGSTGVAIGLALQGSLSNFAGGVLILVLRPFKVGDYIIEDTKKNEGSVLEISLFYTKLLTADDKIVILPNGTLANTSLTNVTSTPNRKLEIKINISLQSDLAKAKEILQNLLMEDENVIKEEVISVYVDSLEKGYITLGLAVMVQNGDYSLVKWRLLENIKNSFDEAQIEISASPLDVRVRN